ncbi:1,4-dihydroxy-6-naphthoate synthase [Maridesulfovibrio ferrireducens]|uniref:1,4-dihydroxy-6-naphtoate synthase n=1 Tax=Maridesulfovibrio ferrireducens TaxID=246191 RepID=A0A1G9F507_9BACT|nr:1,4-dihydroxy-6-naphthoate synthase [Maridesulfovibrio ferrireducens]SDK83519.1 1,4-dihydroxy-6-naphthoate synthase [Maridesulfovibrio ferrireducens]
MSKILKMGYSPCPNDTFIFHALASGAINIEPYTLNITLADVEELNSLARAGRMDICKVSVHAAAHILNDYILLRAGGAMGRGVGPLLLTQEPCTIEALNGKRIAIPGRHTTANLLFNLMCREAGIQVETVEKVFDEIMPAIVSGEVDGGVVIHEGRFTFKGLGLSKVADLGKWWEDYSGLPIPLGCIAIKRSLGSEVASLINSAIRRSLTLSYVDPDQSWPYIKEHAQEMDDDVVSEHIDTFVTDYSMDVGEEGEKAVSRLLLEAAQMDSIELPAGPFFIEEE